MWPKEEFMTFINEPLEGNGQSDNGIEPTVSMENYSVETSAFVTGFVGLFCGHLFKKGHIEAYHIL